MWHCLAVPRASALIIALLEARQQSISDRVPGIVLGRCAKLTYTWVVRLVFSDLACQPAEISVYYTKSVNARLDWRANDHTLTPQVSP